MSSKTHRRRSVASVERADISRGTIAVKGGPAAAADEGARDHDTVGASAASGRDAGAAASARRRRRHDRPLRSSARLSEAPPPVAPREAARDSAAAAARRARAAERAREVVDGPRVLRDKCRRLARALRNAKHLVVYTGAGISTAADIPDYRGPRGVWTRLQRGERVARVDVARARPTFTHMALTALWARGALKFLVSQNCDGLHVRAGLPRRALAELHGDMYCERCPAPACRRLYLRAVDVTRRTARHRHATRRLCHLCGAELRDTIVHFGERGDAAWPLNWAGALRHAARADVVLCLGSSLKVLRRYPRLWRMHAPPARRPRLYIVNLQWTPKDSVAALKINARCDDVMRAVARRLRLRVPRYRVRRDPLRAHAEPLASPEAHTAAAPLSDPDDEAASSSSSSASASPSASDSDEELPLRRLADRLRARTALRAFRVRLKEGDATVLLRPEHAPPPPAAPGLASASRRVRIARHRPAAPALDGHAPAEGRGSHPPPAPAPRPAGEEEGSSSLAAAIFARAVLLCRAELYPGLHTILAPPAAAAVADAKVKSEEGAAEAKVKAEGECAWCLREWGARRCLWYGPPLRTPLCERAWRRVGARRYLCACCPQEDAEGEGEGEGEEERCDGGGWYGKGYRKGRRRR